MSQQQTVPSITQSSDIPKLLKHPIFQLIGLRSIVAEHTQAEEKLLQKHAKGRKILVEIGVAEGASALAIRRVIDPAGTLYLVDPYRARRIPGLNFTKIVSHRSVSSCHNGNVCWIQDFSYNASKTWNEPIDFVFIDGDHTYEGCLQDWHQWSPFVVKGGIVAFHDARLFPDGWTEPDWGPVRVVDELFFDNNNPGWLLVDEIDSIVVFQKINSL